MVTIAPGIESENTMKRTEPLTYGDRAVEQKNFQDMLAKKPRLAQIVAALKVKERQRAFAERFRKRK